MRSLARSLALGATASLLLATTLPARAEDIDLYTALTPKSGIPNVLIVMDNAAAWDANASFTCATAGVVGSNNVGKDVGAEQCALYNAVASFKNNASLLGNLNLGLMMFDPSSAGGQFQFPASAPYTLPLMDTNGVNNFLTYVQTIDRLANKANSSKVAGGMQEAWAFFAGKTGLSGTSYTSPITNPCQRNYVIYIANAVNNGKPQDNANGATAFNAMVAAGATTAQQQQITIPTYSKYQANWGDEWARFMYQSDLSGSGNTDNPQNIVTYTISVTDGNNPDYVAFDGSMASNGGGKNYVVQLGDVNGMADALLQIFNEVQAVNSVFASVSLPAAVNSQGQFLNQVYIGMFRPDASAAPRWMGNLKQYKAGYDSSGTIVLQDSAGNAALSSSGTGFMSPNAVSFWTAEPPLPFGSSGYGAGGVTSWPASGFWVNSPAGKGWNLDSPDGEVVEKGGAAEMMRAQYLTDQSSRVLYTCNGAGNCPTSGAMPRFDASNTWLNGSSGLAAINASTDGAPAISQSELPNLVNWMRGRDVAALDGSTVAGQEAKTGPGTPVTVRPSIHGDVLHSRPVVINYGGSIGVVAFYGANDGVFHAVNANQKMGITSGTNSVRPGGELWGFIPPEFLSKLSRIYTNSPEIKLATTPSGITPAPTPRDYFFDGSTTVMQDQRNASSQRTIIYLTARRGGSLVYAIEVTDPLNPRFLWVHNSSDIPELGQTWSKPRLMRAMGYSNPLLIMGAGYDPAEDSDPSPGVDSMGRGVIVLDAYTGTPVWSALANCKSMTGVCVQMSSLTRSIAADVTVVDRTNTGYMQMAYVGDVGGNLWRVDFQASGGNAPANWTMTQLATLGGAANTNNARKFFYAPDVVPVSTYNAIMIGTGDREHPLYSASTTAGTAYNVVNRFYMIKDTNTGSMPASWTPITEANLTDISSTSQTYNGTTGSGFYITLPYAGEKVVNAPLTVGGYTYFGTNYPPVPKSGACYPNLGIARDYAVSFLTGAGLNPARSVLLDGGGFPPSPVYGMVAIANSDGTSSLKPILFGGGNQTGTTGGSALQLHQITISGAGKRKRTYWYSETDKK